MLLLFLSSCKFPCFFGTYENAGFCRENDDDCVCCTNTFVEAAGKVKESGSIDDVNFNTVILERSYCGAYGKFTFGFFGVEVANGISFGYGTKSVGSAGHIKKSLSKAGFAVAAVTGKCDISDIFCFVLFQSC